MAVPRLSLPRGEVALPHAPVSQVLGRDRAAYSRLRSSPLQLGRAFNLLLIAYCGDLSRLRELEAVVLLHEQVRLVQGCGARRRERVLGLDEPRELTVRCVQQRVFRLAAGSDQSDCQDTQPQLIHAVAWIGS